jgi:two-component system, sporulation sensor kinase E
LEGGVEMRGSKQWTLQSLTEKIELTHLFDGLFLIVDEAGDILRAQAELAARLGYTPEELLGRPLSAILKRPDSFTSMLEANASHSQPTLTLMRADGTEQPSDYTMLRVQGEDHSSYVIAVHIGCASNDLNLLQRFAGAFIKGVNLGVILIDMDFLLVDISDTACRVLGVQRDRVLGRPMEEVFAAVPIQYQLVQRTLLDGIVVKNHAISWTNDQERHELIMDSSLLKDQEGRTVGAYVMFKDVSNLRSLEQQVQRSDRLAMIGQIAAGTAHEIRNPLTSIKGFLQVLKKTLRDNGMEKEYGYTELMLSEIDRINDLVSEFLLLSKPKHTTMTKIDVAAVIREILPIINNEAILHGVTVEYQSALDLPNIVADRELLKQVFINICKNGIEAMGADGGILTITEKVDAEEQRLNVLIQDTGPGIPSFLIDKIFDPFFTTKEEGTGLGLSVCQRIVHDIGGALRVSSKGYGTIFVVSIPYAQA